MKVSNLTCRDFAKLNAASRVQPDLDNGDRFVKSIIGPSPVLKFTMANGTEITEHLGRGSA